MKSQTEKAHAFRALHETGIFLIPNPWDIGSARILEHLGFAALATTSAGFAFSTGRSDAKVGRTDMLAHVAAIANATALPVSADLENGYGDEPEAAAETIRLAAVAGAVGGSIEDATSRAEDPIYEFELAVDRVRAASEAARSLPFPFTLTARAENLLVGRNDLKDTIRRLQAYQEAGADVLYAPCLNTREEISAVLSSVDRPVNLLLALSTNKVTLADVRELGVRRVSIGSGLARAAYGALLRGAREMLEEGTFTFASEAAPYRDLNAMFASGK